MLIPVTDIGGVKDSPRFPGDKVLSTEAANGEGNANGNNDTDSTRKGIKISQEGLIKVHFCQIYEFVYLVFYVFVASGV